MKKFFYSALLLGLLMSCDENTFTNDIEIPQQESDRSLVVEAVFIPGIDTVMRLSVVPTFFIDEVDFPQEEDLIPVSFSYILSDDTDGEVLMSGSCEECNDMDVDLRSVQFEIGHEYSLQVDAEGYDLTTARSQYLSPGVLSIERATLEDNELRLTAKIADVNDQDDFFAFRSVQKSFGENEVILRTRNSLFFDDLRFEESYSTSVLSDESFAGQSMSFTYDAFLDFWSGADSVRYIFQAVNWTEDYYRYERSLLNAEIAEYFPFSEPSSIHSNFDNSFGIFAIMNISQDSVTLR